MTALQTSSLARNRFRLVRWRAAGAAAALVLVSSQAEARPTFPAIVQDTLELDCPPPCLICHTSPVPTDEDSAVQPFATNVIEVSHQLPGTVKQATDETLPAILKILETPPCLNTKDLGCKPDGMGTCTGVCNSDGKGDGDIAALRNDLNPNDSSQLACPKYGCGASRIAPARPKRPIDGTAVLAALGAVAVLASRWRRRR